MSLRPENLRRRNATAIWPPYSKQAVQLVRGERPEAQAMQFVEVTFAGIGRAHREHAAPMLSHVSMHDAQSPKPIWSFASHATQRGA